MAKLLYVDSDSERTRAACDLFARRGHVVTAARSAGQAMICVQQNDDYDAIAVALNCRWLQRWSSLANVPRVVFTGAGARLGLNLQDGLPRWLPADAYVHGLEDLQRLLDVVEGVLRRPCP